MKKVVMIARQGQLSSGGAALRDYLEQNRGYELCYREYVAGAYMPVQEMREQAADFFVIFDLIGMEQITLTGAAAMNRVDARILHVLTHRTDEQEKALAGALSLTMTFLCDSEAEKDRLLRAYPDIPDVRVYDPDREDSLITAFTELAREEYRHEPVIL